VPEVSTSSAFAMEAVPLFATGYRFTGAGEG
jgi:hypothetical protein